jgi:NAD(P)-dependent dehydrogenase (short-subunit alcohol dehydrogenase family)
MNRFAAPFSQSPDTLATTMPTAPSQGAVRGLTASAPAQRSNVPLPMREVGGKVAFISGGSSGIGLGIARAFAEAGMKIAIGYRDTVHAEQAMAQLSGTDKAVHAIRVDVTDRPGMEKAAKEVVRVFGKVHVLVNNAGVQNASTLGIFNGIRAFLPCMREHGEGGHVITTSSILGLITGGGTYAAYCASKFAATAMMETLRAELSDSNIGVSVLCPGPVKSNLEEFLRDFRPAADPFDIGRLVLRGMQKNNLYILTHPEFNPLIQCRAEAIIASTPKDLNPSDERKALARWALENSAYPIERDRHSATE